MTDTADTATSAAPPTPERGPSRATLLAIGVPIAVALVVAGFLLWTRAEPSRQGGYCTNATLAVTGLLDHADASLEVLLQPVDGPEGEAATLAPSLGALDVARLQVDTPAAIRPQVEVLAGAIPSLGDADPPPDAVTAFAAVLTDYHRRCLLQG